MPFSVQKIEVFECLYIDLRIYKFLIGLIKLSSLHFIKLLITQRSK